MSPHTDPLVSERMLSLLNNLPTHTNTTTWAIDLRNLFLQTFPDVDHVVISIVSTTNPLEPKSDIGREIRTLNGVLNSSTKTFGLKIREKDPNGPRDWLDLIGPGKESGFPFDQYHDPIGFNVQHGEGAYCGAIILFRKKGKSPISETTTRDIERILPFLGYVYSDHVSRRQNENPTNDAFRDIVHRVGQNSSLTKREIEALLLLVSGYSYDGIADALQVARGTVNTHIKSLYRKTGTSSVKDLFARYILPSGHPSVL